MQTLILFWITFRTDWDKEVCMYVIYKPKIQEIRIAYGAQNDPKPNLGDGSAEIPMSNTTDQFSSKKKRTDQHEEIR